MFNLQLCVTLLLRNYIVSLKSDGNEDNSNHENVRSGIPNNGTIGDNIDDVAPWPNLQQPNLPCGIETHLHRPSPSGK